MKRRSYCAIDVIEAVICFVCLLHWSRFQRVSGCAQSARQKTHMALLRDSSTAWMNSRRQLLLSRKTSLGVKLLPKRLAQPQAPTMHSAPRHRLAMLSFLCIMRAATAPHSTMSAFQSCNFVDFTSFCPGQFACLQTCPNRVCFIWS